MQMENTYTYRDTMKGKRGREYNLKLTAEQK